MQNTYRLKFIITSVMTLIFVSCMTMSRKDAEYSRVPSSAELQSLSAADAFLIVHRIATSPRCTNCHVKGERPMQLEGAQSRLHNMYIHRDFTRLGGQCTTCHQTRNFDTAHMPPGAVGWRMPSLMKAYDGATTPAQLCQIWTSAANHFEEAPNEGVQRTKEQLLEHVETDPLVRWAFEPGPGRTPALKPAQDANGKLVGGHEIFVDYFKIWIQGGAPCPLN